MKNYGVGAVLTWRNGAAIGHMRAARTEVNSLRASFTRMKDGMRTVALSGAMLGATFAAINAPLVKNIKGAFEFEHVMSGVQAVAQATPKDLLSLRDAALQASLRPLGYSATEAAGAMEELARVGFETNAIIKTTPGVMAAAAAEGMPMAQAAEIVGITLRGMGINAEAGTTAARNAANGFVDVGSTGTHVADVLALAAARTNESIAGFGEAMTYGASQAAVMGLTLHETVAAFGIMANFGRRGSLAGTSFRQMLVRLADPTNEAIDMLSRMGLRMKDVNFRELGLLEVTNRLKAGYERLGKADKERAASVIYGIRGMDAFNALLRAEPGLLEKLTKELEKSQGAAEAMARIRLDNVIGQFTMLKNASSTMWNIGMLRFQNPLKFFLASIVDRLRQVAWGLDAIQKGKNPIEVIAQSTKEHVDNLKKFDEDMPTFFTAASRIAAVAEGFNEALEGIRQGFNDLRVMARKAWTAIGGPQTRQGSVREFARLAVQVTLFGAVLGPVLLAFAGLNLILSQSIGLFTGSFNAAAGFVGVLGHMGKATKSASAALAANAAGVGILSNADALAGGKAWGNNLKAGVKAGFGRGPYIGAMAAEGANWLGAGGAFGPSGPELTRPPTYLKRMRGRLGRGATKVGQGALVVPHAIMALPHLIGAGAKKAGAGLLFAFKNPLAVLSAGALKVGSIFAAFGALLAPIGAALLPIFLMVGAITALFLLLRKRGETVGQTFVRFGGAITKVFTMIAVALPKIIKTLGEMFKPLWDGLLKATEPIAEVFQGIVGDIFKTVWSILKPIGQALGVIFGTIFKILGQQILPNVGKLLSGLGGILKVVWAVLKVVLSIVAAIIKLVFWVVRKLLPPILEIAGWILGKIAGLIGGIGEGISKGIIWGFRKAASILATILNGLSGLFRKLGIDVDDAVAKLRALSDEPKPTTMAPQRFTFVPEHGPRVEDTRPKFGASYLRNPFADLPKEAVKNAARQEAQAAKPTVEVDVTNNIDMNAELTLPDGEPLARTTERYRTEVTERSGGKLTPYQRQSIALTGVRAEGFAR